MYSETVRSFFYDTCPLCIPKNQEEGLSLEALLANLKYVKKKVRDGKGQVQTVWEDQKDGWNIRMEKILTIFATIIIQPEQKPFSLEDAWNWLANVLNYCARVEKPESHVAISLSIVMPIISKKMAEKFKGLYTELLCQVKKVVDTKLKLSLAPDHINHTKIKIIEEKCLNIYGL